MAVRNLIPPAVLLLALASLTFMLVRGEPSPPAAPPVTLPLSSYAEGRVLVERRGACFRVIDGRSGVMGTRFVVEVAAPDEETGRIACARAYRRIFELERAMSTWRTDSLVSRVNAHAARATVRVDPDTFRVLEAAAEFVGMTGGAFDPTVGPAVALWRTARDRGVLPDPARVDEAAALVGFSGLVLLHPETRSVRFTRPGVSLDLAAIAKGYAADVAAWTCLLSGATACRVNAGGDHVAVGAPPWAPGGFRVTIRDPDGAEADTLAGISFDLADRGVATSGNYERYTEIEGKRYSHILDPRSARPVEGPVVQVTVLAPTGTAADALATALTVLGEQRGLALAESLPDVEALFLLRRDGGLQRRATTAFPGTLR